MIRKHFVCVAVSILMTFVFAQEVEFNNPSTMASIDTKSFSFTYIGHAYGADNDSSYWQNNSVDYPATALLSNISLLKEYDFAVFGGDVIQRCLPEVVDALETSLLNRLDMPVFNSAGIQDYCLAEQYGFDKTIDFVHGNTLFLIVSSEFEDLEEENNDWLVSNLNSVLDNEGIKNVFVFTHRPLFLAFLPELQQADGLVNTVSTQDESQAEIFLNVLDGFSKTQKNVYWLASNVGKNYPLITHNYSDNVQFIASGLYDTIYDHILNIEISSDTNGTEVEIDIVSLGGYEFSSIEDYSYEWLSIFVKRETNIADSVTYLKSIKLSTLEKFAAVEQLNTDAYQNQKVKGHVDWATYNRENGILTITGWAPVQTDQQIRRWFGYEGDFDLELQGVKTIKRPDVAKIFGEEQLNSGFELRFKVLGTQNDLMTKNLCFFSQTDTDGIFILRSDNSKQVFNCKIFPEN